MKLILIAYCRTINSFELQELLDACLPNDYIKSCASIDICRQVVSLLDVSIVSLFFGNSSDEDSFLPCHIANVKRLKRNEKNVK